MPKVQEVLLDLHQKSTNPELLCVALPHSRLNSIR